MTPSFPLVFGSVLVAIALIGGGVASWHNVRNARGPRERAFVIQVYLIGWLLILSLLVLAVVLDPPFRYIAMLAYFGVTPWLIYRWALRHQLIRKLDERERDDGGGSSR